MTLHTKKIRAEVPFGCGRMAVRKLDSLMQLEIHKLSHKAQAASRRSAS